MQQTSFSIRARDQHRCLASFRDDENEFEDELKFMRISLPVEMSQWGRSLTLEQLQGQPSLIVADTLQGCSHLSRLD